MLLKFMGFWRLLMHPLNELLFRKLNKKSLDRWKLESRLTMDAANRLLQSFLGTSLTAPRLLGFQADGTPVTMSEEDRENHIHILGAPGEGKSKFLELLIRGDIERGYGCCLLDPSENGDTAKRILQYCCKVGFEKVCYINPVDFFKHRVPVFNPIKYGIPATVSVGNIIDALQVLWGTEFRDTPRIQRYVTAVLQALYAAKLTLAEIKYFLSPMFHWQREDILQALPIDNNHRFNLEGVYKNTLTFNDFLSSVNRLNVFNDPTLELTLGSKLPGIPFTTLISKGWVILVNLDPQSVWGTEQIQQRLLGTLIINEINHAIHRLNARGWKGAYYLYIDEVGDYATSKLAYILDKKRKTGLRFILAHQRFEQIEDRNVLSAVRGSAKTKVLFFTPNNKDRLMMLQDMGYGGKLSDRDVLYTLRGLEKAAAAINVGKKEPTITYISQVEDIHNSPAVIKDFKNKLYSYEWFHNQNTIKKEIDERLSVRGSFNPARQPGGYNAGRPQRKDFKVVKRNAKNDGRTNSQTRPRTETKRSFKSIFSEEED